jgi:hypothetical protein
MWWSVLPRKSMLFKTCAGATVMIVVLVGCAAAQTPAISQTSLCDLQSSVPQGQHRSVVVRGIYLEGLVVAALVDPNCSSRSTAVEFRLSSHHLQKRLKDLVDKTSNLRHVYGDGDPVQVVFEGQFYGPRAPDPRLPEQVRKALQLSPVGWDSMNNSKTKIVVEEIKSVVELPADHPCASTKDNPWPCWHTKAPTQN